MLGKIFQRIQSQNSIIDRNYQKSIFLLVRVAQAYLNQKRLDAEAKQLYSSATNFAKQTQQWMNLIEGFSNALKVID